jgi:hypothetical protein
VARAGAQLAHAGVYAAGVNEHAEHEAAHCTVAHGVGRRVVRVLVGERATPAGRVTVVSGGETRFANEDTPLWQLPADELWELALTSFAGLTVTAGGDQWSFASINPSIPTVGDLEQVMQAAWCLGRTNRPAPTGPPADPELTVRVDVEVDFMKALDVLCQAILSDHRKEWVRLALVLGRRRELAGPEVHRLLGKDWFGRYRDRLLA